MSTLLFSLTGGVLSRLNSSTHKSFWCSLRNLCFLVALTVFSLVFAAPDRPLLNSYLSKIRVIENLSCSACGHPTQGSYLILHCPARDSLRHSLIGDSLSLYDLWSNPFRVGLTLGLHGLQPCPSFLGRGRVTTTTKLHITHLTIS